MFKNIRRKYLIWKLINSVDDITADSIKAILKGATIKTKQIGVSIPIVKRYYTMLKDGSEAPSIQVYGNIIIEGNHRYIAGMLFGSPPSTRPAGQRPDWWIEEPIVDWDKLNYHTEDWEK